MNPNNLQPLQEVTTIAAGNAATALSKLTGHRVTVAVPSVKLVAVEKILGEMGDASEIASTTLVRIKGDIQGLLLFSLNPQAAQAVAAGISNQQPGDTSGHEDQTVLNEMVNIISGAALSAVATFLALDIMQSVPGGATDMIGAVLDPFIAEFGSEFETVLIVQELFAMPESGIALTCTIIIDPPSTAKMLEKMTQKVDPGHATDN